MNWKAILSTLLIAATLGAEPPERLNLRVIPYESFIQGNPEALADLNQALFQDGIVAIRGIPGLQEKVARFIESARNFSVLPDEVKETYSPDRAKGDLFLGYEEGKERFQRPDGTWVIDNLKISYYASVPDVSGNIWPQEVDLKTPFLELGDLMAATGEAVMRSIDLLGSTTGLHLDEEKCGRMLYYRKSHEGELNNPYWCGAHFDHCLFTALLPAVYFSEGNPVPEPEEAGLFIKPTFEEEFKKVEALGSDVMLFQVGEFGQLASNDKLHATQHRVNKAHGAIERYTMALFFTPPPSSIIHSTSTLTSDARYEGLSGDPCSYQTWHKNSFHRYLVNPSTMK